MKDPLERIKFMQRSQQHANRQQEIRVKTLIAEEFPEAVEFAKAWQALGRTLTPIGYKEVGGEWVTWREGK